MHVTHRIRLGALTLLAITVSVGTVAQTAPTVPKSEAEAKTAVEARQAVFKDIKTIWTPLTDMLKGQRAFDAPLVANNLTQLQGLAAKLPDKFSIDTHAFPNLKTDATDNIWGSLADFRMRADTLGTTALASANVAKGGDKGATLKAIADVGKTCGACHRDYKVKKD
jgi:cytochrome c556